MADKPKNKRIQSKEQMRNLAQNRDLSEEEFNARYASYAANIAIESRFEERIEEKLSEFAEDYDIDDLKINDKMILRQLARSVISLEDYQNFAFNLRTTGISNDTIILFDKVEKIMFDLIKSISSMQDDLKITRKIRKGDKEEGVIQYLESVKLKAKKFYQNKHQYIFCPKCKMLLATAWFLYPTESKNKVYLVCKRVLDSGEICGTKVEVTSKELIERRGANIDDIPESLK